MDWSRDASTGLVLPASAKPSTPAGSRASVAQMLRDDLTQLLTDISHDKVGHAMAVAGGQTHWRAVFTKEYGACWNGNRAQCDIAADTMFRVLTGLWRTKYPGERASAFLDSVQIATPLSEREQEEEIENAWQVDIASSDASMERSYYGAARTRKGRDIFSSAWQRPQKA